MKRAPWVWEGKVVIKCGAYSFLPDAPLREGQRYVILESLPPCRHTEAVKNKQGWCRECGADRQMCVSGYWTKWIKPRRGL